MFMIWCGNGVWDIYGVVTRSSRFTPLLDVNRTCICDESRSHSKHYEFDKVNCPEIG